MLYPQHSTIALSRTNNHTAQTIALRQQQQLRQRTVSTRRDSSARRRDHVAARQRRRGCRRRGIVPAARRAEREALPGAARGLPAAGARPDGRRGGVRTQSQRHGAACSRDAPSCRNHPTAPRHAPTHKHHNHRHHNNRHAKHHQCIVDAKDREIATLRGQIGADAAGADEADKEVARLTQRIRELEAAAASGGGASGGAAAGAGAGAKAAASGAKGGEDGGGGAAVREQGAGGRPRQEVDAEVVALNVSGVEVWAQRSALALVEGSRLRGMFAAGGGGAAPCDVYGRPFLCVCRPLGCWLRRLWVAARACCIWDVAARPCPPHENTPPLTTTGAAPPKPTLRRPYQPEAFSAVVGALHALQTLDIAPSSVDWRSKLRGQEPYFVQLLHHLGLHQLFYSRGAAAAGGGRGGRPERRRVGERRHRSPKGAARPAAGEGAVEGGAIDVKPGGETVGAAGGGEGPQDS